MWSGSNVPKFHMDRCQSLLWSVCAVGLCSTGRTRTGGNAQGPPSVELRLSDPSTFYDAALLMLQECFLICSEVIASIGNTVSTLLHTQRGTFALPSATSQLRLYASFIVTRFAIY